MKIPLLIALLAGCLTAASAQHADSRTWIPYIDSICSLEFPSNWRLDHSGDGGTHLMIYAPQDDGMDDFSENISLIVTDLSAFSSISLEDIAESSVNQAKQMIPGIQFIENKYAVRDGLRCHILECTGTKNEEQTHHLRQLMVVQGRLFTLNFRSSEKKYVRYMADVQRIFSSFLPH